ncbi:MAG: Nitroreductase [Synergistales bacterium 57_84]|jgi:nitroreductase|nr:MAG: Nitroreductase [Synergistales bacterium 57_84]MDI9393012.1 nitroreductase family protein [Synergistota bacterium]
MSFLDLVRERRSVRSYRTDPVARDAIDRCLEAARLAPSACNSQPWRFVVVDTPEFLEKFVEAAYSGIHTMNAFARTAPVQIAVVRENARTAARLGGFVRGVDFTLIDIGIACEHLVLQAAEEGIGSCILGWFDERSVRKILGLPRSARVDLLICMGYPQTPGPALKHRKTLDEIRSYL